MSNRERLIENIYIGIEKLSKNEQLKLFTELKDRINIKLYYGESNFAYIETKDLDNNRLEYLNNLIKNIS